MAFLGFFGNKKSSNVEKRSAETESNNVLGGLLFGKSQSNSTLSLSAVFCAIEIISNALAQLPIIIKRVNDTGKEIDYKHNLNFVFKNNLISKWQLIKNMVSDMYRFGNGYAYIKRANDGTPTGLMYLPSQSVSIEYNKRKQDLYYRCTDIQGKIEPINMLHIYKNADDEGMKGIGIMHYASRALSLAGYAESAAETFFSSGCQINGVLTVNGTLSDKQKQEIRYNWEQTHSGANKNGIAVLPGNMTYQNIGSSASDAQLLESRLFNLQEIARYFCISPTLLGDLTHSSYSTLEQSTLQFLIYTLQPIIANFEEELNRKLILPSENGIISIDIDEGYMLKGDKATTASYLNTLVNGGILSINEARHQLGLNPIENGDKHIIPYTNLEQNTIDKEDVGASIDDNPDSGVDSDSNKG